MSENRDDQQNKVGKESDKPVGAERKYPERAMARTTLPESMKCVYAGPPLPNTMVQPPMVMVYAGPEMFRNGNMLRPAPKSRICPFCRGVFPVNAKFCPDCGAKLNSEDTDA